MGVYDFNLYLGFELRSEQPVDELLHLLKIIDVNLLRIRGFYTCAREQTSFSALHVGENSVPLLPVRGVSFEGRGFFPNEILDASNIYTRLSEDHGYLEFSEAVEPLAVFIREQLSVNREALKQKRWGLWFYIVGEVEVFSPSSQSTLHAIREVWSEPEIRPVDRLISIWMKYSEQCNDQLSISVSSYSFAWSHVTSQLIEKSIELRNAADRSAELLTDAIRRVVLAAGFPLIVWELEGGGREDVLLGNLKESLPEMLKALRNNDELPC